MPKIIYFLTGASGVGKTTLTENLKEKYRWDDNWVFLHFDSIWVPEPEEMIEQYGSWENWQRETTYMWIEKMIREYGEEKTVVFEGQVNLEFIQDGFDKHDFSNYRIILVDCNTEVMKERLIELRGQAELFNQDMINWLNFLRTQATGLWAEIIDTSNKTEQEVIWDFERIKP